MSPKNELTSVARDRLLEQHLGEQPSRVYEFSDKSIVALFRNNEPVGSVLIAVLPEGGSQPNFAVYSTKPARILPNDEVRGSSGDSPSFKPDYYLQRLKHATELHGLHVADALAKIMQGFSEHGEAFEALREYLSELGIETILHNEPQVFVETDEDDLRAGYVLLVDRQFTFHAGSAFVEENELVSAAISCKAGMSHFPSDFVIITIGPANNTSVDFNPRNFNLKLRDAAGNEYLPDYSIADSLLAFTGLKEGETYTFAKAE